MVLGIAVEIHAALVGGAVSGAVVLVGVLLAEYLRRRAARRLRMETACRTVQLRLPLVLAYMTERPPDPGRLSINSPGWRYLQEVTQAMTELEASTRGRSSSSKRLNRKIVDLDARVLAAQARLDRGEFLTRERIIEISADEIGGEIFRHREPADAVFKHYFEVGPTGPRYVQCRRRRHAGSGSSGGAVSPRPRRRRSTKRTETFPPPLTAAFVPMIDRFGQSVITAPVPAREPPWVGWRPWSALTPGQGVQSRLSPLRLLSSSSALSQPLLQSCRRGTHEPCV